MFIWRVTEVKEGRRMSSQYGHTPHEKRLGLQKGGLQKVRIRDTENTRVLVSR